MKHPALGVLAGAALLWTSPAFADSRALTPVERAYQEVDFPTTHDLAQHALQAGGAGREDTTRLYVLLGISAAALGDAAEAKQDFIAALAIDPSLKLEKSLSPKIRDPYLEAQGYWSAAAQRLALSAKPGSDSNHLIVKVVDPATLVAKTELRLSAVGASPKGSFTLQAAPATRFTLPLELQGRDYELALRALDRYGNVLAEYGVDTDPILMRQSVPPTRVQGPFEPAHGRSYLLPVVLGVAGLGALTAGVVFHIQREHAAQDWNGASCEQPGQTRLEQCQDVDSRIHRDEALAIGFYAGGGALLAGSVIALVAGRTRAPEPAHAAGLSCVMSGPGVACAGHF